MSRRSGNSRADGDQRAVGIAGKGWVLARVGAGPQPSGVFEIFPMWQNGQL